MAMKVVPWIGTVVGLGTSVILFKKLKESKKGDFVNKCQQKDVPKVVTVVNPGELEKKTAYCRCWKSKKFPYCDGTHDKHNKATGDNVGPLIVIPSNIPKAQN